MNSIKTAISLQKPLFDQAEALASELEIPRSRLFALAVEEFIQRHQNEKLLAALDEAYADNPDPEEETLRHQAQSRHRQLVDGEW